MAWYRTGTVAVTGGSPNVVGTGTLWASYAKNGDGMLLPDGKVYEVLDVVDNTHITLATNYSGSTASGQAYGLFPTHAYSIQLASQVTQLIADYSAYVTGPGAGKFSDGSLSAPGIAFASDTDTGFYRYGANTIGVSASGAFIGAWNNSGLGVGVVPSQWAAGSIAVQVGPPASGFLYNDSNNYCVGANAYYNAGWKIQAASAAASMYQQTSGSHIWYRAPAGAAGSAITWDDLGRLNTFGFCVGTAGEAWSSAHKVLGLGNFTRYYNHSGGYSGVVTNAYYDGVTSTWKSLASAFSHGYEFDLTTGDVNWNQASPSAVGQTITWTRRMSLTAAGRLLLGAPSAGYSNTRGLVLDPLAGAGYWNHSNTNASGDTYFGFAYNGAAIGSITQSGTTAVAYNTTSDRRLKDGIAPAGDSGAVIDAIEIVQHDWRADGSHVDHGVIAQDLHAVYPAAVTPGDTGEEIEQAWGVDYSKLVPLLVKEIQSLRARVAALES